MNITCSQLDLHRALSVVSRIVPSRGVTSLLKAIKLSTDHGQLTLSATDLEIEVAAMLAVVTQEEGSVALPASIFSAYIASLQPSELTISSSHTWETAITSRFSLATLRGMDPATFPVLPKPPGSQDPTILDAGLFKTLIRQVAFAAATDGKEPVFTGVLLSMTDSHLRLAGSDRFLLAQRSAPLARSNQPSLSSIIPARTLRLVEQIFPNEGTILMYLLADQGQVVFEGEQIRLASRLIEGTYPDYRKVLRSEWTTRVGLSRQAGIDALTLVLPCARENASAMLLSVTAEGELSFEAEAEGIGRNCCTVDARVEGPAQTTSFHCGHFLDVFKQIETEQVVLELTSNAAGCVTKGVLKQAGEADYLAVMIPMVQRR